MAVDDDGAARGEVRDDAFDEALGGREIAIRSVVRDWKPERLEARPRRTRKEFAKPDACHLVSLEQRHEDARAACLQRREIALKLAVGRKRWIEMPSPRGGCETEPTREPVCRRCKERDRCRTVVRPHALLLYRAPALALSRPIEDKPYVPRDVSAVDLERLSLAKTWSAVGDCESVRREKSMGRRFAGTCGEGVAPSESDEIFGKHTGFLRTLREVDGSDRRMKQLRLALERVVIRAGLVSRPQPRRFPRS